MATAVTVAAGAGAGGTPPAPALAVPPNGFPRDDLLSFSCGTGTSPAASAAVGNQPAYYILAVITFGGGYTGLSEATRPVIQAIARNAATAALGTPFVLPSTNNQFNVCVPNAPAASMSNGTYDFDVLVSL